MVLVATAAAAAAAARSKVEAMVGGSRIPCFELSLVKCTVLNHYVSNFPPLVSYVHLSDHFCHHKRVEVGGGLGGGSGGVGGVWCHIGAVVWSRTFDHREGGNTGDGGLLRR